MAIKIKAETYENASEILSKTELKLHSVMNNIKYVYDNLDSQINSYIGRDLLSIKSNIDDVNYKSHELSIKIKEKIEDFKSVEKKTEKSLQAIGTIGGALIGNAAFGTAGAIAGTVAGHTLGKNIINNTDISSQTAAVITEAATAVGDFFSSIKNTLGEAVEDVQESIGNTASKVATSTKSAFDWVVDKAKEVGDFVWHSITHPVETLKKTGASIANTAVGLVQGLGEFGEALYDTFTILGSACITPYTLLVDGIQWGVGKITGDENWSSATKSLWGETMDFVSTKYVTNAFDSFHQNNAIGKWLDENAYSPFKSTGAVYKVADGVGYIGGIILLTLATMGIGGAAAGAGAGGAGAVTNGTIATINFGKVATISITKQALTAGAIATTAGFGKNTQNAWADGANLGEGLAYGTAMGLWEGAEMIIGAEINTLKFPGLSGLKGQLITTGSHVALDTIDGGSAGIINPMMQMIYNPNEKNMAQIMYLVNYDENGNQINNKIWDDLSFSEKYQAMFKYNGGWGAVGTQAITAGVMSFITEIPDIKAATPLSKGDLRQKINDIELKNGVELFTLEEIDDIMNGKITMSSKELDDIVAKKLAEKELAALQGIKTESTPELPREASKTAEIPDSSTEQITEIIENAETSIKTEAETLDQLINKKFNGEKGLHDITIGSYEYNIAHYGKEIADHLEDYKKSVVESSSQTTTPLATGDVNKISAEQLEGGSEVKTIVDDSNTLTQILDETPKVSAEVSYLDGQDALTKLQEAEAKYGVELYHVDNTFDIADGKIKFTIEDIEKMTKEKLELKLKITEAQDYLKTLIQPEDPDAILDGIIAYKTLKKIQNKYQLELFDISNYEEFMDGTIKYSYNDIDNLLNSKLKVEQIPVVEPSAPKLTIEAPILSEIDNLIDNPTDTIAAIKNSSNGENYNAYGNYSTYLKTNEAQIQSVIDSLSEQEREIIKKYISESDLRSYKSMNGFGRNTLFEYKEINGQKVLDGVNLYGIYGSVHFSIDEFENLLKKQNMTLSDFVIQVESDFNTLKGAIEKSPLTENMVLFRGVDENFLTKNFGIDSYDSLEVMQQKIMTKGIICDDSFLSTSATPTASPFNKSVQLILNCEKGTPALDFSKLGGIFQEQELLLAPGQAFKITDVQQIGGHIRIYADTYNPTLVTDNVANNALKTAVDNSTTASATQLTKQFSDYLSSAPIHKDVDSLTDYITKQLSQVSSGIKTSDEGIKESAAAVSKYLDEFLSGDSTSGYYELLNISGMEIDSDIKSMILQEAINNNKRLREAISSQATYEITSSLESLFGITDPTIVKKVRDSLLGDSFIESGIGASHNWEQFVTVMNPYFKSKVQSLIDSGQEPVIWSKIEDSCHEVMNNNFVTIENSTIGGEMYFLDSVYSNWNNATNGPMLEDLWGKLSKSYAAACCEAINPATGAKFSSIKFLYPESYPMDECFGNLFKTVEFPEILSHSTIDTITMTKVIPETMEIVETIDIDISDIAKFYKSKEIGIGTEDTALIEEAFEQFLAKIKEKM